ncbi:MAG: hypothetical protein ABW168_25355, partial [Sedimenticola sp.]
MLTLNPCEYKCYVLMKLVNTSVILPSAGNVITSYHCKTALFWTIENTVGELWVPENLVQCLLKCFSTLLSWVEAGNCPNFFIPAENMFKDRLSLEDMRKVKVILSSIVRTNGQCLLDIESDSLGSMLRKSIIYSHAEVSDKDSAYLETKHIFRTHLLFLKHMQRIKNDILNEISKGEDSVVHAYNRHRQFLLILNAVQNVKFTCCLESSENDNEAGREFRHFGIVLYHLMQVIRTSPVSAPPDVATVVASLNVRLNIPKDEPISIEYTGNQIRRFVRL